MLFTVIALSSFMVAEAEAQIGAIRRAREALDDRVPSLATLFGSEPALTTTINDAKDGVPLLDDFKPPFYSPLGEMPRGRNGDILVAPGSYSMWVESFCLQPGTWGPHLGEGYLHTTWKGPKAELISAILQRYPDERDVPQQHAQKLIWAIIARAKFEQLDAGTKWAASRLLKPAELADLNGWGLNAVSNAVRDRVLATVPAETRRVLEAENELRRLMTSAEVEYRELERTAVREGTLPPGDAIYLIPEGRWSYHPGGFFIRYLPAKYTHMRVDIYKPEQIQLRRDASGRIVSIAPAGGPELEFDAGTEPAMVQSRHDFSISSSLLRSSWVSARPASGRRSILLRAAAGGAGSALGDLVRLARADVEDLVALRERLGSARLPDARLDLVQRALHAALVRRFGIEARGEIGRASSLAAALRPLVTADGFTYVLTAVPDESSYLQGGGFGGWGPGGGGGTGGGQRQRLGPTASSHGTPRYLPGRMPSPPRSPPPLPPDEPDALERAQRVMDWFNKAADLFSAFSDPAGFIGGQPQGQMLSAGMDATFKNARQVDNSLKGQDDDASGAAAVNPASLLLARLSPASRTGPMHAGVGHLGSGWMALTRQALTYREFSRPRSIAFPQLAAGPVTEAHARAVNATIATTLRMASTFSAAATTRERLAAAVAARDAEWEERQARALIYLKRLAGTEMVQLARDLESLRAAAGNKPLVTEGEVRIASQRIAANGWTPEALAVARDLGLSASSIEERTRSSASADPARTAREMPSYLSELGKALTDYGSLLAQLPEMRPPWN